MKPLLYIALATMPLVSCHHHDADEDSCLVPDYRAELEVLLSIDKSFFEYTEFESRSKDDFMPRFTVWAIKKGETAPCATATTTGSSASFSLPVGKYHIVAFADYVPALQPEKDFYFFSDDIKEMLLVDKYNYKGNDEYKQAYWTRTEVNVGYKNNPLSMELTSAMSKLEIVATDIPKYEVGHIAVSYPELLPAAIDALTGEISYQWTGVMFNSFPVDSLLAFDYIYSSSVPDSVALKIEVFDTSDNIVARKNNFKVPVARRGITKVRGAFFSTLEQDTIPGVPDVPGTSTGGLGVDPTFGSTIYFPI